MDEQPDRHESEHHGETSSTRGYPRRLVASSARLLETQYRLWERDLKDPEQPLIEYGFRLSPDTEGIDGHACRYDSMDGQVTVLLGGRMLHGRPGGRAVAIDRRTLGLSTAWVHQWSPVARLVRGVPEDAGRLVPRLISWIGGYEQWMLDSGADGRRTTLVETSGLEGELPTLWWRLASEWRAALESEVSSR